MELHFTLGAFHVHFIIFSPWCYHASFCIFFQSQAFVFCAKLPSLEAKKKKNLCSSSPELVFPSIAVSWMKINEKTFPLSASALGIVRKLNYGDSSQAKCNNICIIRAMISLGIVTLLLSNPPNWPSLRRLRTFPRIGRPTGVRSSGGGVI